MPSITIDGKQFDFEQGQTILDVASENNIEIPHYCYHPSLSIVASCRICLAEVWAPNPRNDDKLEPMPKLLPPTGKTPRWRRESRITEPFTWSSEGLQIETNMDPQLC